MRVLLTHTPDFLLPTATPNSQSKWIAHPDGLPVPCVTAYRTRFAVETDTTLRVHVSADERYELFLDGQRIGRGSERGDASHWYFESYDLILTPGAHWLTARVWALGSQAAYAQMTVTPGFFLCPDDPQWKKQIGTGVAEWEVKALGGYAFTDPDPAWGTGANVVITGAEFDWDFADSDGGSGWVLAAAKETGVGVHSNPDLTEVHRLVPATLPPMHDKPWTDVTVRHAAIRTPSTDRIETNGIPILAADNLVPEQRDWQALIDHQISLTIPAQTSRRILLDLNNYVCAYPEILVSGGAGSRIRINWQEALYQSLDSQDKGNRDVIEGKYFVCAWWPHDGVGDLFLPEGGEQRRFETLWWQCGRYVEIVVQTGETALTLESLTLHETRYPLEQEAQFDSDEPRLAALIPIALRTLQMCAHETYMDCPFYEQLQYIGDTRLEALTTYVLTPDARLPRKAIQMFEASRLHSGLTQSRYPSRVVQVIPPFSLWWIGMVYDYALWRDDPAFVQNLLPGVRGVLDAFSRDIGAHGLLNSPNGWNYIDWVPNWKEGSAVEGHRGPIGPLNGQLVLALTQAAKLEEWAGEPELAARARRLAGQLAARVREAFWDDTRGLLADNMDKTQFSEHSQCLALLGGHVTVSDQERMADGLLSSPDLARTTIYFTHYLFETYYVLQKPEAFLERMGLWFDLSERGLKTTVEMPEPTRSDCHAWGSHPVYHYFASLLGIRPTAPGFTQVRIAPQLGPLNRAQGSLPHPKGVLTVDLRRNGQALHAAISLPDAVTGVFGWNGQEVPLTSGAQEIEL